MWGWQSSSKPTMPLYWWERNTTNLVFHLTEPVRASTQVLSLRVYWQSYGAEDNRKMGVPGEELAGVYSAKDFVGWYNGLPSCQKVGQDVQGESCVCLFVSLKQHNHITESISRYFLLFFCPAESRFELRYSGHSGSRQRGLGCSQDPAGSHWQFEGEQCSSKHPAATRHDTLCTFIAPCSLIYCT